MNFKMEEGMSRKWLLLEERRKKLEALEKMEAVSDPVPFSLINKIEYERAEIARLEQELSALDGLKLPEDALVSAEIDGDGEGSAVSVGSPIADVRTYGPDSEVLAELDRLGAAIAGLSAKLETSIRRSGVTASIFGDVEIQPEDNLCFVLMPFGDDLLHQVYEVHIKPTVEQSGLRCQRADDVLGPTPIMEDIWQGINGARVVLAELTGQNPNVFYELGLCHAIGKDAILIAQDIKWVPFDVRHRRAIIYTPTPRGLKQLENLLAKTLEAVVGKSPDSP